MSLLSRFEIEKPGLNFSNAALHFGTEFERQITSGSRPPLEILAQQAEALRRLGHINDAFDLFTKTLVFSRKFGSKSLEGWSLWGLGMISRVRGDYVNSKLTFQKALEAARCASDRRCMLWCYAEIAETDRITGRLNNAYRAHHDLLTEFKNIGDWKGVCWAFSGMAQIHRLQNNFSAATLEFKRSQLLSLEHDDIVGFAWSTRGLAEIAKETNEIALAVDLATQSRAAFQTTGYALGAAYALKTQADLSLLADPPDQSFSLAQRCHSEFLAAGERRGIAFSLITLGLASARLGDLSGGLMFINHSSFLLASTRAHVPIIFSPNRAFTLIQTISQRRFYPVIKP